MSHPRFGQAVWHINLVKRRFFATPDVTPLASISRRPNCGGFPPPSPTAASVGCHHCV